MWGLAPMVCTVPSAALPLKTFSSENLDNVFQECGEAICFLLQTTGARDLRPLASALPGAVSPPLAAKRPVSPQLASILDRVPFRLGVGGQEIPSPRARRP